MRLDVIEQYLNAVERHLPIITRADIKEELRTLIDDMLLERCGDLTPTDHDLRVVLTELGEPEEMAEKYSPVRWHCLIGEPYYRVYTKVVWVVMIMTAAVVAMIGVIMMIQAPGSASVALIARWLLSALIGALCAYALVTISFSFYQRRGRGAARASAESVEASRARVVGTQKTKQGVISTADADAEEQRSKAARSKTA